VDEDVNMDVPDGLGDDDDDDENDGRIEVLLFGFR
jgi:hypothetical protein